MPICIYCNREKDSLDFSKEHILPKSLIGTFDLELNPFVTNNVCQYCNNVAGMFIDAPAMKGWYLHSKAATGIYDFACIEENPTLPLHYMGIVDLLEHEGRICELYIGPTGDTIYHFHYPYPDIENLPPMIGVPPSIRGKEYDSGFAFIFIASNNPVWHPTIIISFISAFKGSVFYCGNCENLPCEEFSEIPSELLNLLSTLCSLIGKSHKCQLKISPHGEKRFLAKLALGIGSTILGEEFLKTEDARLLREFMWAKTPEERENIPLKGVGFFNENENNGELIDMFGWDGGHVITIINLPEMVGLNISLFNSLNASIKICDSHGEYQKILGQGICYVIVPGLRRMIGPLKMIEFLSHKHNMQIKIPELISIENEMNAKRSKPPKKI